MKPITTKNDAFGREMWAYLTEGYSDEIVGRETGGEAEWRARFA